MLRGQILVMLVISALLLLLASCSTAAQNPPPNEPPGENEPGTVSGTLLAPGGQSVFGTLVVACLAVRGCEAGGNAVLIETHGTSAPFAVKDLTAEPHHVFAWKDTDANEEVSTGDLLGVYSLDGENAAPVTLPASGIQIRLELVQSAPGAPFPVELLGEWQDPSYVAIRNFDLYDPVTGYWLNEYEDQAGSGIRFNEDGTYVWGRIVGISNGGCRTTTARYHRGTVMVSENTLTLYPQVHREMYNGGCSTNLDYDRDASLEPQVYSWQLAWLEDERLGMSLQSADGTTHVYAQR